MFNWLFDWFVLVKLDQIEANTRPPSQGGTWTARKPTPEQTLASDRFRALEIARHERLRSPQGQALYRRAMAAYDGPFPSSEGRARFDAAMREYINFVNDVPR